MRFLKVANRRDLCMFKEQSGVTLIEVLVTLLITTIGLLGLAALQLGALQATSDSAQRSQAVWLMQDLIERIRANPQGSADDYLPSNNCSSYPAKMCATYKTTAGAVIEAADCSAVEMATFDRWETQCRYSADSSVSYTSRDSIATATNANILTLTKTTNADDAELRMTASWLIKGKSGEEVSIIGGDSFTQDIQREKL